MRALLWIAGRCTHPVKRLQQPKPKPCVVSSSEKQNGRRLHQQDIAHI